MSVLLVGPPPEIGTAIVRRLIEQGDEVRVITSRDDGTWRALGAHVALGDPQDDDLVMRAGQHARTIVLFGADPSGIDAALRGASAAGIERVVLIVGPGDEVPPQALALVPSHVVLRTARRRLRGSAIEPAAIAAAVDAADDLAGDVTLDLDLMQTSAWALLGISQP